VVCKVTNGDSRETKKTPNIHEFKGGTEKPRGETNLGETR